MSDQKIDQRSVDLPALVGRRVRLRRAGRTLRGRCPLHNGKSDTSLTLWETDRGWAWCCQAGCAGGDAIAWLMKVEGLTFRDALAELALDAPARRAGPPPPPSPPDDTTAPPEPWQEAAGRIADEAAGLLWRPEGARAIAWLRRRGLSDDTIRRAGLGFNPADRFVPRPDLGLPLDAGGPRTVAVPRGVTIPWRADGALWQFWVRTPGHAAPWRGEGGSPAHWPKYHQLPGGANALWGADDLRPGAPVMLLEGVFDALAVRQEAGDLIVPVVTGTTGARRIRWIARMALAPVALLAFDADAGGDSPTAYWADVLPRARVWKPYFDDPAAMLAARPGCVRAWVLAGLDAGARIGASWPFVAVEGGNHGTE